MGYENVNELSFYTEKWLPVWGQRFDQEDPYCADGHSSDEGAWERPRDVDWPSVQPGQVLRHHARAQEDVARVHGQDTPQIRKLLRGRGRMVQEVFILPLISITVNGSFSKFCIKMLHSKPQFFAKCVKCCSTPKFLRHVLFTLLCSIWYLFNLYNEFVITSIGSLQTICLIVFPLS